MDFLYAKIIGILIISIVEQVVSLVFVYVWEKCYQRYFADSEQCLNWKFYS